MYHVFFVTALQNDSNLRAGKIEKESVKQGEAKRNFKKVKQEEKWTESVIVKWWELWLRD